MDKFIKYFKDPQEATNELVIPGYFKINTPTYSCTLQKQSGAWSSHIKKSKQNQLTNTEDELNAVITALTDKRISEDFQYAEFNTKYQSEAVRYAKKRYPVLEPFKIDYVGILKQPEKPEGVEERWCQIIYIRHLRFDINSPRGNGKSQGYRENKKKIDSAITAVENFMQDSVDTTIEEIKWRVRWLEIFVSAISGNDVIARLYPECAKSLTQEIPLEEMIALAQQKIVIHPDKPYQGIKEFRRCILSRYCSPET